MRLRITTIYLIHGAIFIWQTMAALMEEYIPEGIFILRKRMATLE